MWMYTEVVDPPVISETLQYTNMGYFCIYA